MARKEIQIVYTVPNQKVVTVMHDICDRTHLYTMCNVKSNSKALKELSPNTYKLYMYFSLNQDGYTFALSYQAVHNATGMSDKTYQKAVNELIDKKYLVPSETKNLYIFYDGTVESEDRKVENTQQEEKELPTDSKNGFPKKVKIGVVGTEETTGEILQDNTKNNTIDNNELADAQTIASLKTSDAVPIKIFRNKTYELGRFIKVSIDDKKKNEHMYDVISCLNDNASLEEVLSCARANGIDRDYACSYIANNF